MNKRRLFLVIITTLSLTTAACSEEDNTFQTVKTNSTEQKEVSTEKPTTEKPTTEEPTTEKPTTEKPTTEKPTTEKPKKEKKIDESKKGTVTKFPVNLAKSVDGDTAYFYDHNGEEIKARFLLIDTPETKHPRMGVQPFGPEASERTAGLLTNASKIEIEYDVGQKQDHFQRDLVYVYVDGEMLNNILVREGLARVNYVQPPNTRYLYELRQSEEQAKSEKIGIWSIDSAFGEVAKEESVKEPVKTEEPTTEAVNTTSESFDNCTELNAVYPDGVPSDHPSYQDTMDRDKDNYACEKN